ncbi:hypothetical protein KIN20_026513 [Parelaphostrongylus tenuis]|uniref:Uncharacterized protein n=1 Tax=Parelaphostrongylus tenuis TaxID=148309 RepID=A0AAD5QY69_PARTN|nr:hypothetical protein KIN20_026513 [Parelaphostrongylus tenuis]
MKESTRIRFFTLPDGPNYTFTTKSAKCPKIRRIARRFEIRAARKISNAVLND